MSTPKGIRPLFENIANKLDQANPEDVQAIVIYASGKSILNIAHTENEVRCRELLDMAVQAMDQQSHLPGGTLQ